MAAYISVPRDFSKVKSKVLFNLTARQLVCFSCGILTGIPVFFLLRKTGNVSLAALGMILVMMPMFLLAMYEKNGQPLEVIVRQFIEAKFIRPKSRPYRTDNYYELLMRQARIEKEVDAVVHLSQKSVCRTRRTEKYTGCGTGKAFKKRAEAD